MNAGLRIAPISVGCKIIRDYDGLAEMKEFQVYARSALIKYLLVGFLYGHLPDRQMV